MAGLLRNISWLGLANAAVKPVWFLFITAFCMRVLGADGYGVMNAALALSLMGTTFTDLGMARHTVREVARDRTAAPAFFTNFFALRLGAVLLATVVVLLAAWMLDYRGEALLAVAFACAYTLSLELTNYCRSFYEAFEELRRQAIMLVVEKALVVGGGLALLFVTAEPHWTLAGMAAGMMVTTAVNAAWIARHLAGFRPRLLDRGFVLRTLRVMIPLGLAGVFFNLYFRVDLVMVEAMLSELAAGQYGAAYRILEALNMLPSIVVISALYPRLSRLLRERALEDFARVMRLGMAGLGLLSIGIAGTLTLWGPELILLLDPDPEFTASGPVLQVLAWAFPFLCANSLLYSGLVAMDDDTFTAAALGVAVLANVMLNFRLIPALGIEGAAQATVVTELALLAVYAVRYRVRWRHTVQSQAGRDGGRDG